MIPRPEFSRPWDLRQINDYPVALEATAGERSALARRFGIVAIDRLAATLTLLREGEFVQAQGRLEAKVVQSCAVSGENLATTIDEPLVLRFAPAAMIDVEELELAANELDEIAYEGQSLDLGEAVAQSLALAIDPYLTGPQAERVRHEAGLQDEATSGPFAALAALRKSGP